MLLTGFHKQNERMMAGMINIRLVMVSGAEDLQATSCG